MFGQLIFLDLSENSFRGSIPSSIFSIPSLKYVYLSKNQFAGSIPSNYGKAINLKDLYLDSNSLTGTVPPIAANEFQELTEFLLQENDLIGTMPASICELRTPVGVLEDLWANCEPNDGRTEIVCECCTQCFPSEVLSRY